MSAVEQRAWWKEAVVYQIYPRSFKDSNGDGIGDIRGIISKLDYIKSLGIDVIWLNPVYSSPNHDMGYDISDYQNIVENLGTMDEFDELLEGLHQRGIKLVMDLVVNHTSDEHYWFQESRKSRDNPYRDYYHWWPAEKGVPPERCGFLDKDGKGWTYDSLTDAYYLHYFSSKQPDLNWENPVVRKQVFDMMHFWLKKGVDGFRMDVISYISKDISFPLPPEGCEGLMWESFYANGPRMHEYLQEMNREVLQHYDILTVAEAPGLSTDELLDMVAPERKELQMAYHFEHPQMGLHGLKLLTDKANDLVEFKKIHTKWDTILANRAWGSIYLGNHDQPRMVTRWGNDSAQWRDKSSKLLTTFLLSMRATPFYYMGDELGMSNIKFDNIDDYRDIETLSWYNVTKDKGGDLNEFMESHKITGRDNGRTPVQWDMTNHGGFTDADPWIKVNENFAEVNVAAQEGVNGSCLDYFRKMVKFRKQYPVMVYGDYQLLYPEHTQIYAYTRILGEEKVLVLLNFSDEEAHEELTSEFKVGNILMNNGNSNPVSDLNIMLEPWQASVYELA